MIDTRESPTSQDESKKLTGNGETDVSFSNIRPPAPLTEQGESITGDQEGESEEEYYLSKKEHYSDNGSRRNGDNPSTSSNFRRKPRIQGQSAEKRKRIDPESGSGRK